MTKQRNGLSVRNRQRLSQARLPGLVSAVSLLGLAACGANDDIPTIGYVCGTSPSPADSTGDPACGVGDPNLPPEPQLPTDVLPNFGGDQVGAH